MCLLLGCPTSVRKSNKCDEWRWKQQTGASDLQWRSRQTKKQTERQTNFRLALRLIEYNRPMMMAAAAIQTRTLISSRPLLCYICNAGRWNSFAIDASLTAEQAKKKNNKPKKSSKRNKHCKQNANNKTNRLCKQTAESFSTIYKHFFAFFLM